MERAPPDAGNLALYIFFLQGVGSLFSWNSLISATADLDLRR